MASFGWQTPRKVYTGAAQSSGTTSTLDIYSTIGDLEVYDGTARLIGKVLISIKINILSGMSLHPR